VAAPGAKLNAGPGQPQALSADETKFVICDQPIEALSLCCAGSFRNRAENSDHRSIYVSSSVVQRKGVTLRRLNIKQKLGPLPSLVLLAI
jgi:hypothetical protein